MHNELEQYQNVRTRAHDTQTFFAIQQLPSGGLRPNKHVHYIIVAHGPFFFAGKFSCYFKVSWNQKYTEWTRVHILNRNIFLTKFNQNQYLHFCGWMKSDCPYCTSRSMQHGSEYCACQSQPCHCMMTQSTVLCSHSLRKRVYHSKEVAEREIWHELEVKLSAVFFLNECIMGYRDPSYVCHQTLCTLCNPRINHRQVGPRQVDRACVLQCGYVTLIRNRESHCITYFNILTK